MFKRYKGYLINLLFPAFVFGSVTGVLTAVTVSFYKILAKYVIHFSEKGYHFLKENLFYIPIVLIFLFLVAFLFDYIYKKEPNLGGGGIPASIGIVRGVISFNWLKTLVGTFFLSLISFFIGVPLGNEGPSVQMGTAIGKGVLAPFSEKHKAWNRYSMTGGACAGFSVATGAPVSGILFAIEEAHQRISPMIMIVSSASVMSGYITTQIIGDFFGLNFALFPKIILNSLPISKIWIPAIVGVSTGLFSVLFLRYFTLINLFFNRFLKKIPRKYKIFFIFLLTLISGIFLSSAVSTGHELILSLLESSPSAIMLLIILILRTTLTLSANTNSVTGGLFIPILAIGTVFSALIGKIIIFINGNFEEYYLLIIVLGITACISGMMKMPLTAIVFSIEVFSSYNNILYVLLVAVFAYIITEIFYAVSINDSVLEARMEREQKDKTIKNVEARVKVRKASFAIGKQVRDIFWPSNMFVLSIERDKNSKEECDDINSKAIKENDWLNIRYSTFNEEETLEELYAIIGEQ